MSTNLATSSCPKCGHLLTLEDVRGRPLEIRRSRKYAPHFGVRFDCGCGEVYFVILRRDDTFWDRSSLTSGSYRNPTMTLPNGQVIENREAGRFVIENGDSVENAGYFNLDLSYYSSFRDEPDESWKPGDKPRHLCENNADDAQWVW